MKVLNRIALILFAFTLLISVNAENTSAATYVDKEFATLAKKGQLKGVPGKIGMTYKTLKKKEKKGSFSQSESYLWHHTKKASYAFFYGDSYDKISSKQKVVFISREVSHNITAKQMQKYFGKPVAENAYKAGKYYVRVQNNYYEDGKCYVQFGTKDALNAYYTPRIEGIYRK